MKKAIISSLIPVFMLTALSGCSESDFDMQRKGDLIDTLATTSLQKCEQVSVESPSAYKIRLRIALNEAASKDLDVLLDKNVTVCLDKRLSNMQIGMFNIQPYGIYYGNGTAPVLSLYDNGKMPDDSRMFETTVKTYSDKVIGKLADGIRDGDIGSGLHLAGRFSCGKNCIHMKWKDADAFSNTLSKNPAVEQAPVFR